MGEEHKDAETPRQFSYRLIIGQYSTETKVGELNRVLDKVDELEKDMGTLRIGYNLALKRLEEMQQMADHYEKVAQRHLNVREKLEAEGEKLRQLLDKISGNGHKSCLEQQVDWKQTKDEHFKACLVCQAIKCDGA